MLFHANLVFTSLVCVVLCCRLLSCTLATLCHTDCTEMLETDQQQLTVLFWHQELFMFVFIEAQDFEVMLVCLPVHLILLFSKLINLYIVHNIV